MPEYRTDCRCFNGYKPCAPGRVCERCGDFKKTGTRILLINLDAQGTVLRTTSLLAPIKRKYPESYIVQLTDRKAVPLLKGNQYLDRIYEYGVESITALMCEEFDVLLNVDKSRRAAAAANIVKAGDKKGYGLNRYGAIVPLNESAAAHYELGLDDEKKFFKNTRTEQDMLAGAFEIPYDKDEYVLNLGKDEITFCEKYRKKLGISPKDVVIGFNVGSSLLFPYKRIAPRKQTEIMRKLKKRLKGARILLLGGREDTDIVKKIKASLGKTVMATPTTEGLRRGICYTALCDIVVTGDSLGMHLAIGLKKQLVVWFGPTCENEIELYGRGVKVVTESSCRPCWKPGCDEENKCNESVNVKEIVDSVVRIAGEI